jgi:hypothetical protein
MFANRLGLFKKRRVPSEGNEMLADAPSFQSVRHGLRVSQDFSGRQTVFLSSDARLVNSVNKYIQQQAYQVQDRSRVNSKNQAIIICFIFCQVRIGRLLIALR